MTTPIERIHQRAADESARAGQQDVQLDTPVRRATWRSALRRALLSGSVASVACTLTISLLGHSRTRSLAATTNATSHWIWGEPVKWRRRADIRHTAVGYAIHHASAIFWAVLYERWRGTSRPPQPVVAAGAISVLAHVVDYHVVPPRLTPGFDRHLTNRGMSLAYGAFAAGLAATALWRRQRGIRR